MTSIEGVVRSNVLRPGNIQDAIKGRVKDITSERSRFPKEGEIAWKRGSDCGERLLVEHRGVTGKRRIPSEGKLEEATRPVGKYKRGKKGNGNEVPD